MAMYASARSIGTFVFVGLAVLIGGLIYFSAGELFQEKNYYVSYFTQNVKGLNQGAPVAFRGVQIGEVTDVAIVIARLPGEETKFQLKPRVVWEVYSSEVRRPTDIAEQLKEIEIEQLIEQGVRATLSMQSFLTGQLYLSLDYFPDEEPRYLADKTETLEEMPSIDTSLTGFIARLEKLPFEDLVQQAIGTLKSIEDLAENPDLLATLDEAKRFVADADQAVRNLDNLVQTDGKSLLRSTNRLMTDADRLLQRDVKEAVNDFGRAMTKAQSALQAVQDVLEEDSPLYQQLMRTLESFTDAARSLEDLTDYLEQHPESILQGKP